MNWHQYHRRAGHVGPCVLVCPMCGSSSCGGVSGRDCKRQDTTFDKSPPQSHEQPQPIPHSRLALSRESQDDPLPDRPTNRPTIKRRWRDSIPLPTWWDN